MKKWVVAIVAVLFFSILAACGNSTEDVGQGVNEEIETEEQEVVAITDMIGKEITLETQPERIVTLIPSVTETVFTLGLGDHVVGRTDWCNFPEQVSGIQSVGGMEFDIELILSLNPDLVIGHEMGVSSAESGFEQLRDAGIPILIVGNETNIEDVYRNIQLIGKAIGATDEAENLVNEMKESFAITVEKAQAISEDDMRKVWIEIDPTLITVGKDTFLNEMLQMINAVNVAGEQEGWPKYTEEDVVIENPDVIITTYGYYVDNPRETILTREGWKDVGAIKNERVYDIDNDTVTRAGPRLVEGVEELAKRVYPEVFTQ